jgi:hypothetical protein
MEQYFDKYFESCFAPIIIIFHLTSPCWLLSFRMFISSFFLICPNLCLFCSWLITFSFIFVLQAISPLLPLAILLFYCIIVFMVLYFSIEFEEEVEHHLILLEDFFLKSFLVVSLPLLLMVVFIFSFYPLV